MFPKTLFSYAGPYSKYMLEPVEAKCRSQCRADETCANYKFSSQCVRRDWLNIGALIFRIGCRGPLYYTYNKELGFRGPLYYTYNKELA